MFTDNSLAPANSGNRFITLALEIVLGLVVVWIGFTRLASPGPMFAPVTPATPAVGPKVPGERHGFASRVAKRVVDAVLFRRERKADPVPMAMDGPPEDLAAHQRIGDSGEREFAHDLGW